MFYVNFSKSAAGTVLAGKISGGGMAPGREEEERESRGEAPESFFRSPLFHPKKTPPF